MAVRGALPFVNVEDGHSKDGDGPGDESNDNDPDDDRHGAAAYGG